MSEAVPGECRSGDCDARATWYVEHASPSSRSPRYNRVTYLPQWHGEFCHAHMLRCIELKFAEIRPQDRLIMERIRWES